MVVKTMFVLLWIISAIATGNAPSVSKSNGQLSNLDGSAAYERGTLFEIASL